jgi:hypothetical protein
VMIAVRDDTATTACAVCGLAFGTQGRQRFCSTLCRQIAWRRRRQAPVEPLVGEQRCEECNTWCRRVGPGGLCPCCDEPVAVADLLTPDQLAQPARAARKRRR